MNIHDERTRLAEQAVKTFSRFVEENVEKFGRVLEREEPNRPRIDDIEETWGELKTRANQIITATGRGELYEGLAKTVPEKEMIEPVPKLITCALTRTVLGQTLAVFQDFTLAKLRNLRLLSQN